MTASRYLHTRTAVNPTIARGAALKRRGGAAQPPYFEAKRRRTRPLVHRRAAGRAKPGIGLIFWFEILRRGAAAHSESEHMKVEPLDLNYRLWGSGKPLIIAHGLFGSAVNWNRFGQGLARKRQVFALDLRNHGNSPHSPDSSYAALVEDLNTFMARRGMEKAVLVGHSLGGKVMMAFADRYPDKAERLVVLDIAPRPYPVAHRAMLEAMIGLEADRITSREQAFEALAEAIPFEATRQFVLKNLVRGADGRYRWRINLEAIDKHLEELSQGPSLRNAYPKPALFLRGGASAYISDADALHIRRYYPEARIVTIEGAGHWLHADAREKTLQAVDDFLSSDY